MLNKIINQSQSFTRSQLFFLALALYFIGFWIFQCFHLIYHPIPTEFRDWSGIDLSNALFDQSSPYSFSVGPPFFYVYGLVFPLLAGGLSWILHIDIFLVTKLFVCTCIILSAVIIAYEIYKLSGQLFPAILGFAAALWTGSATNAVFILNPASCGLLIILLILFQIRRSQSLPSILLAALGTVLAFYTKQYFIYIFAPVFLFLIANAGVKKALIYGLLFLGILILSIVLISYIYPAYFYAAILAQFYAVGGGWGHARSQLILFFNQYWPLIFLLLIYLWRRARKQMTYHQGENLYLLVFLVGALCLIPLGRNTGSFLSYYYQLALPSLIIIGLISLSRLRSTVTRVFFITVFFIFSIFHGELLSYRPIYSEQALQKWKLANQIIVNTKGPKLISSPILAPIMGESILLDNGHTEYYVGLETPSRLLDILLPRRHDYFSAFDQYFKGIESKITRKEFKLITTTKDFHPMIAQSVLEANYFKLETIDLQTGGQTWVTEFWVPKD
jgi:hypothetical protein